MRSYAVRRALLSACAVLGFATCRVSEAGEENAAGILAATGVKGGLVVHLGCGDGELTAALRANESYLVHGLDSDAANVEKARAFIRGKGLYGPVSVERLTSNRLPYAENLVNLLVAEELGGVSMEEVMRVLAPLGVAYVKQRGMWKKTMKPWPADIDEWTHFLHDASNNAVAHDRVIGPPRRLQWVGGPVWARYHDTLASMSALVSARGRIFSIEDHGPVAFVRHPASWFLTARDAFNGVVLWQREIPTWVSHNWTFRGGPAQITRRLVAEGDCLYVTPGYNEPVLCLDAATGKTLMTYADTAQTREILWMDGMLLLAISKALVDGGWLEAKGAKPSPNPEHTITAIGAETGETAWKRDAPKYARMTLAAAKGSVCFQDGPDLICVELKTGREMWRAPLDVQAEKDEAEWLKNAGNAPTLVMYGEVVLYGDNRKVIGLAAKDGKRLWEAPCTGGFCSPPDVLVAGGLVWLSSDPVHPSPYDEGRNPMTGKVEATPKRTVLGLVGNTCTHARCYRNKATDRWLLIGGEGGVQFHSLESAACYMNDWIRGTCQYGIMPANGLLYAPPHACACFIEGKLSGFYAAAPETAEGPEGEAAGRLEQGPACAAAQGAGVAGDGDDWPTYRHDAARSGVTAAAVPGGLRSVWKQSVGADPGSLVVAGGTVYAVSRAEHTVHSLDAATGAVRWSRTVGGRVDSPPTVCGELVLFGSADGWAYCLRAADGQIVWRFLAGPSERQVVAHGELESAWPVSGSLLVEGGAVYVAAGRTIYLDGGIYLHKLDVRSGKVLAQGRLQGTDPKTGEAIVKNWQRAVLPDVLSSDGTGLYMRQVKLDPNRLEQVDPTDHLFSTAGFLDDSWAQRTFWLFGGPIGTRVGFSWAQNAVKVPHARMLVRSGPVLYGFGRSKFNHVAAKKPEQNPDHQLWSMELSAMNGPRWSRGLPIQVHAMALAGDTLLVAGPKGDYRDLDALEGKRGAAVIAVSAADGTTVGEYDLAAPPVWDGMAVARGRLYLALKDGSVVCMGK